MTRSIQKWLVMMVTVATVLLCLATTEAAKPDNPGGGNGGGGNDGGGGGAAYTIVPLVPLGFDRVIPVGLNEMGSAVGSADLSDGSTQAIHYDIDAEEYTTLEGGDFLNSHASDINEFTQIVGSGYDGNGDSAGFFWSSPSASPTVLPPLPGDVGTYARAINGAGLVVGGSIHSDGTGRAVIWHVGAVPGGTIRVDDPVELPPLPGGDAAWGVDVTEVTNGSVVVAGASTFGSPSSEATKWTLDLNPDGTIDVVHLPVGLGTLGGSESYSGGVNNSGGIVGTATYADGLAAPVFAPSGSSIQPLPVVRDTVRGWAESINDLGEIVGTLQIINKKYTNHATPHAYLWRDGEAIDLEKEIPRNSGWSLLQDAWVTNNSGVIGGWGNFNGDGGQGFLLIPNATSALSVTSIPEPSSLLLLASVAWICVIRHRQQ